AFAAQPQAWTLLLGGYYDNVQDYSNPLAKANNWLFTSSKEWTISPRSDTSISAFIIQSEGGVSHNKVWDYLVIRAVFYLQSSVNLNGGNGTAIDPYRIN
ncbi:MAG: hypothetical protein RSF02_03545, partial [Bacilli bacterium]